MKKTLIALLALGSMAMADEEEVALSSPAWTDKSGYTSFDFVLDGSWLTKDPEASKLTETVNLVGITLDAAATWYNKESTHRNQGAGVAIYKKSDNVWNYVGSSSWQTGYGASQTQSRQMTFFIDDGLALSSTTTYTAVFYGNKDAFDELALGSTLTSLKGAGDAPTKENPIVAFGMKSVTPSDADFALYDNNGQLLLNQSPWVTFTVQNTNIPEPTTGTLSLLALAGLCIRRRK